jgi:hypothetical protein
VTPYDDFRPLELSYYQEEVAPRAWPPLVGAAALALLLVGLVWRAVRGCGRCGGAPLVREEDELEPRRFSRWRARALALFCLIALEVRFTSLYTDGARAQRRRTITRPPAAS